MSCSMDTSGYVAIVSMWHVPCTIHKIFSETAHGTPHEHSTHHGKRHGIIAYTIMFHGVYHGVAHVMENTMVYPMA